MKALTWHGTNHTHRYFALLMHMVLNGKVNPRFVITHRAQLDEGPELYKKFRDKKDSCIKVVMSPIS